MSQRTIRRGLVTASLAIGAVALAGCKNNSAKYEQNSLDPKGPAAHKILTLFWPFFTIAVIIGVGVVVGTVYAAIRFRERPDNPEPRQVHGNTVLEMTWTVIPLVILAFMAVFTVKTILDINKAPRNALKVTVTGKQWWWRYEYKQLGVIGANELHIPVGKPVDLTLQSDNVIHSFWVPNLAGKKDVMPGRSNHLTIEASEAGTYLGQCAEYCGLAHADMRLRVIAQTPADFDQWVKDQNKPVASDKLDALKTVNDTWGCTACHYIKGISASDPGIGPNLTHVASRTTFAGGKFEMNAENLGKWIYDAPAMKPNSWKVNGKGVESGVGMKSFRKLNMTKEEAQQIADLLSSLG